MVRDDIELVDRELGHFRIPLSRKIKFKQISFKNISSHWKNFRLNRLKSKLIAQKEKLVEMEFSQDQVSFGKGRAQTERKILRKTQAIARLESKINFLETGTHLSQEFIDSRAIKLKSLMMKNLVFNTNSLYGVSDIAAEQIVNSNTITATPTPSAEDKSTVNKIVDDEVAKISAKVQEIMNEQKSEAGNSNTQESTISKEEIREAVNASIENQDSAIDKDAVATAVNHKMDEVQTSPNISEDEVAKAIGKEMDRIKVSTNGSSPAKVNQFNNEKEETIPRGINSDGTYRLLREDIDDDFRITRFDRSKLPAEQTTHNEEKQEFNIPPFTETKKREVPHVEEPRKAITAINEKKALHFPEIVMPTIKEVEAVEQSSEEKRDLPMIVPERQHGELEAAHINPQESVIPTEEEHKETINKNVTSDDLTALMAKVSILRAEKQTIDNQAAEAARLADTVDEKYRETLTQFSNFANSLEKDCNTSYQQMTENQKSAAAKEAQINAMLLMMEQAIPIVHEKGRTK